MIPSGAKVQIRGGDGEVAVGAFKLPRYEAAQGGKVETGYRIANAMSGDKLRASDRGIIINSKKNRMVKSKEQ